MSSSRTSLILAAIGFVLGLTWPASPPDAQAAQAFFYRAVVCNDVGIAASNPSGSRKSIAWAALSRVVIRTTDDGPRYDDVFWEIFDGGPTPALVYPGGATGEPECLAAMQMRLEGFDDEQLIRAMGSTEDAHFVLWER